jgi:hypothetical protein
MPSPQEEIERVERVDRLEDDPRRRRDLNDSENRDGDEIEDHDRPEQGADPGRAMRLDGEQEDEDADRHRYDVGRKARLDRGQALDRREHRDRPA